MRNRTIRTDVAACLAAGLLGLAATAAQAQPEAFGRACIAERARFIVGQRYTAWLGEAARPAARARLLRTIEPGQVVTREFSPVRLTVNLSRRRIVRSVTCG